MGAWVILQSFRWGRECSSFYIIERRFCFVLVQGGGVFSSTLSMNDDGT